MLVSCSRYRFSAIVPQMSSSRKVRLKNQAFILLYNKINNCNSSLPVESFCLHQRASHVFGEAQRVQDFKRICDEQPPDAVEKLGELMNASHASCRDLYECSHPDVDILVNTCRSDMPDGFILHVCEIVYIVASISCW